MHSRNGAANGGESTLRMPRENSNDLPGLPFRGGAGRDGATGLPLWRCTHHDHRPVSRKPHCQRRSLRLPLPPWGGPLHRHHCPSAIAQQSACPWPESTESLSAHHRKRYLPRPSHLHGHSRWWQQKQCRPARCPDRPCLCLSSTERLDRPRESLLQGHFARPPRHLCHSRRELQSKHRCLPRCPDRPCLPMSTERLWTTHDRHCVQPPHLHGHSRWWRQNKSLCPRCPDFSYRPIMSTERLYRARGRK